jgi:hypothetical protein
VRSVCSLLKVRLVIFLQRPLMRSAWLPISSHPVTAQPQEWNLLSCVYYSWNFLSRCVFKPKMTRLIFFCPTTRRRCAASLSCYNIRDCSTAAALQTWLFHLMHAASLVAEHFAERACKWKSSQVASFGVIENRGIVPFRCAFAFLYFLFRLRGKLEQRS